MLRISKITKTYFNKNGNVKVFDGFNLTIKAGAFVSVFGPNGCGKTTLFDIISGAVKIDSGSVYFKNKNTSQTKIGLIFQNYRDSLFPWMTIRENIAFPLKIKKIPQKERFKKVANLCKQFRYNVNLDSLPYQLSGGQQQFASLLRGLIINPEIYLIDEPFSSLDHQTALSMTARLYNIWEQTRVTTLFVSHDIDEIILLSQQIVLLSDELPTKIIKIIENNLPHPRSVDLLATPEFNQIKSEIISTYKKLWVESSNDI